jgi:glycine cleavage system H protein
MNNTTMKFTSTHEWILQEGQEMIIGITDHAQQLLGDLVFVDLPDIGREVNAGEELGVVESVKAASDFYAPISGTVIAINDAIKDDVALINRSPEQLGWLVKIKPSQLNEMAHLLSVEQYQQQVAEEH